MRIRGSWQGLDQEMAGAREQSALEADGRCCRCGGAALGLRHPGALTFPAGELNELHRAMQHCT
jgi:hypothetical protein